MKEELEKLIGKRVEVEGVILDWWIRGVLLRVNDDCLVIKATLSDNIVPFCNISSVACCDK